LAHGAPATGPPEAASAAGGRAWRGPWHLSQPTFHSVTVLARTSYGGNATVTNNTTGGDGSGGVMLYVTSGNFNFHGNDVNSLNAPTSGPYNGILMWQDKSDTSADTLKGGSSLILNGAIYLPKAALSYNGGTNTTNTTIVCDTLSLVGNSIINAAATTSFSGSSITGTYIME
jgi:hypothetical protein